MLNKAFLVVVNGRGTPVGESMVCLWVAGCGRCKGTPRPQALLFNDAPTSWKSKPRVRGFPCVPEELKLTGMKTDFEVLGN